MLLLGHPPVTDFLGYLTTQTIEGGSGDDGAWMDAWRRGNDHLLALAEADAGYADGIEFGEMPTEAHATRRPGSGRPGDAARLRAGAGLDRVDRASTASSSIRCTSTCRSPTS